MGREVSNQPPVAFLPVDGLRAIFSFWVVACHVISMTNYFVYTGIPFNEGKMNYLTNVWWGYLAAGMGYQVDLFFMISAFLTTWSFLTKTNHFSGHVFRDVTVMLARRLFRLWPMVAVQIAVSYLLDDWNANDWWTFLLCFTFPNSTALPIAMTVQWSTRVDLIGTLVLYATFSAMNMFKIPSILVAFGSIGLSLVPRVWQFVTIRDAVSVLKLKMNLTKGDLFMPVFMPEGRQIHYMNALYPGQFYGIVVPIDHRKVTMLDLSYFPWHQRIAAFFIGFALAIVLKRIRDSCVQSVVQDRRSSGWVFWTVHTFLTALSFVVAFQPVLISLIKKDDTAPILLAADAMPPLVPDFVVTVLTRPLYAASFAYLLLRCMVPQDHALHLRWLNWLWSLPLLRQLSVYSYGVFALHMKVMMEVLWRLLPPQVLHQIFGPDACLLPFMATLLTTYALTLLLAVAAHHLVEAPMQRLIAQPALRWVERAASTWFDNAHTRKDL